MELTPGALYIEKYLQYAAVATGNGAEMSCTDLAKGAFKCVTAQITAIGTATVTWEGSVDGATWAAVQAIPLGTGTAATTATAAGIYRIDVTGLRTFRARISAWTTDPVTITARGTSV